MTSKKNDLVWIVIWFHSGVPYAVEAYRDRKKAQARRRFFNKDANPDYDEVGVFEVKVGLTSED